MPQTMLTLILLPVRRNNCLLKWQSSTILLLQRIREYPHFISCSKLCFLLRSLLFMVFTRGLFSLLIQVVSMVGKIELLCGRFQQYQASICDCELFFVVMTIVSCLIYNINLQLHWFNFFIIQLCFLVNWGLLFVLS